MNQLMWPVVFALAGALAFAFASNGKVSEMGKWTFVVGTFWLCYAMSHSVLRF